MNSCMASKLCTYNVDSDTEVKDVLKLSISIDSSTYVELTFENISKKELLISNPSCYINQLIKIIANKNTLSKVVKIKPTIGCATKMISLKPGQRKTFKSDFKLSFLYQLDTHVEYEIKLTYIGGVINFESNTVPGDISARHEFKLE